MRRCCCCCCPKNLALRSPVLQNHYLWNVQLTESLGSVIYRGEGDAFLSKKCNNSATYRTKLIFLLCNYPGQLTPGLRSGCRIRPSRCSTTPSAISLCMVKVRTPPHVVSLKWEWESTPNKSRSGPRSGTCHFYSRSNGKN